ncbi:hypothetical protein V6N13_036902 [Hibiscus sabdariffa]
MVINSPKLSGEELSAKDHLNGRLPDDLIQMGVPRVLERSTSPMDLANLHEAKKAKIILGADLSSVETKAGTNEEFHEEVCSVGREIADMETSEQVEVEALNIDKDGFYGPWVVAKSRRKGLGREDDTEVSNAMNDQDVSKKGKAQSFVRRQHVLRKGVRVEGGSKIDGNGIEIIALDPIRDSTFEEITISQGKGKHVALKIFEKGHNKQPLGVRGFDKDDPGDSRTPRMGNAMEERPAAVGVDVDAEIGMRS